MIENLGNFTIIMLLIVIISIIGVILYYFQKRLFYTNIERQNEENSLHAIQKIQAVFDNMEYNFTLNKKRIEYKKESESYKAWVYSSKEEIQKIELHKENTRKAKNIHLFYTNGKLNLIIEKSTNFYRYHYFDNKGIIWHFKEKIGKGLYTNSLSNKNNKGNDYTFISPINNKEVHLYKHINSQYYESLKQRLIQKAKEETIEPSTMQYFRGIINDKLIKMILTFHPNGTIQGKFEYQTGQSSLLQGFYIEERFELKKVDKNGTTTIKFKGYFIDKSTAIGKCFNNDNEVLYPFELYTNDSYSIEKN